ncbi:murein hydrolase activator EnvC [Patulibacter sp.]|uniref:murein hydrolase activator EnvC family protein n=1 Tax=Patulibacter sp. TaxID=1912859 RepID=UPI002725BBE2|nr:M23 family metallopeptidase [Patulibacter sp.]MDO9407099.1 M23 family metallopeptidase [Patulibacter sp.]
MKTTAVLLAAVILSCAAGVGASPALGAETPTPTTPAPAAVTATASGGAVAASPVATTPVPAATVQGGTPRVPRKVPDAPARVRAVLTRFAVSAPTWTAGAAAPTIAVRLDAPRDTSARVQVRVEDRTSRRVVLRQSLGVVRSGVDVTAAITARLAGRPGSYRLRLIARDQTGRRIVKARSFAVAAPAPAAPAAPVAPAVPSAAKNGYVFPVQGPCNFRSLGAQRFHSAREAGRAHNGQDIGTFSGFPPVVAVTAATVSQVFYDDAGGGWTIVFAGDDRIDYGYLHLKAGSIVVRPGQRVSPGQRVADAGNTGGDYEPHLHFEMRPTPWSAHRADAVDPMPLLAGLPNPCEG